MLGLGAIEKFAARVRARFLVPSWPFRERTTDNREHENARRARQMAAFTLWRENCGVPVRVKTGDGRDAAYRLRTR